MIFIFSLSLPNQRVLAAVLALLRRIMMELDQRLKAGSKILLKDCMSVCGTQVYIK